MLEENRGVVLYSPEENKLSPATVPDDLDKHFRIDMQAAVIQPIMSAPYAGCDDVNLSALKLSEDDVDEYSGNFRWNLDKLNAWGEVRDGSLETDALEQHFLLGYGAWEQSDPRTRTSTNPTPKNSAAKRPERQGLAPVTATRQRSHVGPELDSWWPAPCLHSLRGVE